MAARGLVWTAALAALALLGCGVRGFPLPPLREPSAAVAPADGGLSVQTCSTPADGGAEPAAIRPGD
jgi:predicted small lipoprotein YifL